MSSSTEGIVLGGVGVTEARMPELRHGTWTRLGTGAVVGDDVTEGWLDGLASSARDAARAQGYAVGWAEGRRDAESAARAAVEADSLLVAQREQARDQEHAAALTALRAVADDLREELARVCRQVDEQAATLALELAEALVGAADPETAHVVRRVTGLLPDHPVCSVRLHPDVAEAAGELREAGITVVADPSLARGDAIARADDRVIDLRIAEALQRLREVLG